MNKIRSLISIAAFAFAMIALPAAASGAAEVNRIEATISGAGGAMSLGSAARSTALKSRDHA